MRLFVDLDGVLADFDGYFEDQFGVKPDQDTYQPPDFWGKIRKHGTFYRDQPPKKDAFELWDKIKHLNPTILTGYPYSIPNVREHKREWVTKHLGLGVEVICCFSRDKYKFGNRGDYLIDDRIKYAGLWINMGGIFIHHKTAKSTLVALAAIPGNPFAIALTDLAPEQGRSARGNPQQAS